MIFGTDLLWVTSSGFTKFWGAPTQPQHITSEKLICGFGQKGSKLHSDSHF